jgi:hypothetical protein
MARALRSNKKPLPPIHGMRELVFSNDEKAEAFADSLELQCRQTSPTLTWITSRKLTKKSKTKRNSHYTNFARGGPTNHRISQSEKSTRARQHSQQNVEIVAG